MIPRLFDWRSRLNSYIAASRRRPLVMGEFDCGLFPAGAVEAMTGFDPAIDLRGTYDDFPSAKRALRKHGFKTHADMAAKVFKPIHPSEASIGDLVAYATDDPMKVALGVVNGEMCFVLHPAGHLGLMGLLQATHAFKV